MQIHWVHGDEFEAKQRERIEARIRALAEGLTDLIDVRITARTTDHHRHGGSEVRLVCQARGGEIVAARTRPDAAQALDDVMDIFERELRRMRTFSREERGTAPPELGVIDAVRADHGFILTDSGERVYFHRNAVHGALDFDALEEGQRVGLSVEGGEKGLQAAVVRPPSPGTP